MSEPLVLYVLDTHSLYWYWRDPPRLGAAADAAFRTIERREALGLVPAIVVAELHFLTSKQGTPLSLATILGLIDRSPSLRLEALARRHLVALDSLGDIPEMHDRLIAAVAVVHDAAVVTRDPDIHANTLVRSVW